MWWEVGRGYHKSSQVVLHPRLVTWHGEFPVGPLKDPHMHPMEVAICDCLPHTDDFESQERIAGRAQTDVKRY